MRAVADHDIKTLQKQAMKRAEINSFLREAADFAAAIGFAPPLRTHGGPVHGIRIFRNAEGGWPKCLRKTREKWSGFS
jgi:hypothetical protein